MEGPPDNRTAEHRRPHLLRQHGFTYSQNLPAGSIFSHPPPSNPLSPYPTPWNGQILQNMESFQVFRPQVWSSASISNVACTSSNNMSHIPQPYMPQPSNSTIGPQTLDLGLQSIHMAADNLEHLELLLEPQGPEERTERLAPRQSALNLPEWEEHRAEIKRLYIDESNSLDKTREIIYKEFGFESSAQLYKTKLNEWGFTKYLPRSVAEWVLAKEKQRLREGKKTVYDYGGRRLNIAEVQRKAKRTKTQHFEASMIEVETPNNLVYATPKTVPPSPLSPKLSPHNITSQATPQLAPRNWKPPPNSNASRPGLPRLAWNGYNRGQLESIHEDARNLASLEEFEEAEVKFCEALNGHEYLLSSVHESTSTLAYDLASFYARCDRMHDAYAVLDWIVTEHLKSSVIGDKETAAHILRVVQLLHSWSRSEEAINLLNKTLVSCQKVAGSQDHASSSSQVRPKLVNPSNKPESPEIANFMPANPATHFGDELSLVNCELKIAKSYIKAAKKEAEPLLLRLIDKCGQDPEKFSAQHFDAVCSLIELYQKPEDRYKLFAALKNAADIFWNIMEGQSGGLSILKTAIKLVRFYIQAELAPTARPMLDRIEREVTRILDEEDSEFVDVLITLGIYYQDHNGWTNAERHFEHALAIVMREHELDCRVVSTLEAALETKFFTLRLPTPEGIRATFRSNGFKRCGCSGYTGEIGGRY